MLLKKDKVLSKQKDVVAIFNKHSGSTTGSLNLFIWAEDILMLSANDTVNSVSKKFAIHRSIKPVKEIFKITSEFLLNHVSTETIKTIINGNL